MVSIPGAKPMIAAVSIVVPKAYVIPRLNESLLVHTPEGAGLVSNIPKPEQRNPSPEIGYNG